MVEVVTGMCARLCGRRGAHSRAMRVVTATKGDSVDEVPV
jgi:putative resolvase